MFQAAAERRLITDGEEDLRCQHTAKLTNIRQYEALAKDKGAEPFPVHVMEENDLIESCRFITHTDVSNSVLKNQLHVFRKHLHPYLLKKVQGTYFLIS